MKIAIFIVGLALLMLFNGWAITPLFGTAAVGRVGAMLWAITTGIAYGIYMSRYLRRMK